MKGRADNSLRTRGLLFVPTGLHGEKSERNGISLLLHNQHLLQCACMENWHSCLSSTDETKQNNNTSVTEQKKKIVTVVQCRTTEVLREKGYLIRVREAAIHSMAQGEKRHRQTGRGLGGGWPRTTGGEGGRG